MNVLRQNTDYALRAIVYLADSHGKDAVSTKRLAKWGQMSYQFTSKILQKLREARLVESSMGPRGGFVLSRPPSKITLLEVIEAVQGPVVMSNCLACTRKTNCAINPKLAELKKQIDSLLGSTMLDEILNAHRKLEGNNGDRSGGFERE